jgi:uncharacterized protein (TIGR04141 family)
MAKRRRSLTVYHIRNFIEGHKVDSFEQILRDPAELQSFNLNTDMPFEAQLFISISDPRVPLWIEFLKGGFDNLPISEMQTTSAVLALKIQYTGEDEIFAFTFGYGRFLLRPNSYDRNYGLRAALNVIYDQITGALDPNRLRSVDAKTVAANTIRTRRQADRKTTFETFGVDIQRDLLNAITGTPIKSETWGTSISGSDSLTAYPSIEFKDLGDYCSSIASVYRKETYKQNFYWIENLRPTTDPQQLKDLEDELIDSIHNKPNIISVTIPEMIEFGDFSGFCFSFDRGNTFNDPDDAKLTDALKGNKQLDELSIDNLRRNWSLVGLSNQSSGEYNWPLFNCLYGEIKLNKMTYILSEGEFWEVNKDFLDELNKYIQTLPDTKCLLPSAHAKDVEGKYNEDTAKSSQNFLLLDKQEVRLPGNTSPIEICDLLTNTGCFIHVKRKLSSSDLSHLFAQGLISADLFLTNPDYREGALNQVKTQEEDKATKFHDESIHGRFSTFGRGEINPGQYEVAYAIIAGWKNRSISEALPFFSKLTLRNHVEELRRMGYKVSMARVNTESGD